MKAILATIFSVIIVNLALAAGPNLVPTSPNEGPYPSLEKCLEGEGAFIQSVLQARLGEGAEGSWTVAAATINVAMRIDCGDRWDDHVEALLRYLRITPEEETMLGWKRRS